MYTEISGGSVNVDVGSKISAGSGMIGAGVTFTNNGTYELVGNNSANVNGSGITSILSGVTNSGLINQNISITGSGVLTSNAGSGSLGENHTISNTVASGLVFTGGENKNTVTGDGSTVIAGDVTNSGSITQASVKITEGNKLTSAADKVNAVIINDGTYNVTGGTEVARAI